MVKLFFIHFIYTKMESILAKVRTCLDYINTTGETHKDTTDVFNTYISYQELDVINKIFNNHLNLQELSNMIHSIKNHCTGDGCGLKSGIYIDDVISEYFKQNIVSYKPFFSKEADMKICDIPLSLKSCTNPKGTQFALNWSKNKEVNTENFIYHTMILVSCSGLWWKNKSVKAGIYFVDKHWCRKNIKLSSNNKTDKLISKPEVYKMIQNSSFFVPIPPPSKVLKFSILRSFAAQTLET